MHITNEDPKQIEKAVLNLWGGPILSPENALQRARDRAAIINREFDRLLPFLDAATSTHTVSSDLKRTVILQQMIRAFAVRILPLKAFCAVFDGVRLEGTNKVAVPYFPLITTASEDFSAATGYNTAHNTNSDSKLIDVDKRKYQLITWTSAELSRQPFMNIGEAALLAGEQLAQDCVNDILTIILAATYGLGKSSPAGSFDSDDVVDLKGVADAASWPASGRSLLLNTAYDINLLKDSSVKNAMAFGDNSPIREGRIFRLSGFDYYADARVPSNNESLQGLIAHKSGLLVAFSPVNPTEEVRAQLTRYEVAIEPTTGAQFNYRAWGDADLDTSKQVIEVSYGKLAGEPTAIKRITT